MVVLISACRVSGGQLFGFSFSHRCASVVRMSACSSCCSFTRLFKLFLFNLFSVGSLALGFWCRGWSGILFIFSAWMRSLACLLPSSGSTPAVFSISAMGVAVVFMAVQSTIGVASRRGVQGLIKLTVPSIY